MASAQHSHAEITSRRVTTNGWRTMEFIQRYHDTLSPRQRQRMDKIYREPLFLLASPNEPLHGEYSARFCVSGSTGTPHTVFVKKNGEVVCSCQDARIHARRCACVCKHACFVLARVMGFVDLSFFTNGLKLPPEQITRCAEVAAGRAEYDVESASRLEAPRSSADVYRRNGDNLDKILDVFYTPKKGLVADEDECPVCYDALIANETTTAPILVWCPTCKNATHQPCMERWMASTRRAATCVLCRSTAWREWRPCSHAEINELKTRNA